MERIVGSGAGVGMGAGADLNAVTWAKIDAAMPALLPVVEGEYAVEGFLAAVAARSALRFACIQF